MTKQQVWDALKEPAPVIYADGTMEWSKNGKLHRDNGPAVIYANGTKRWFKNGVHQ